MFVQLYGAPVHRCCFAMHENLFYPNHLAVNPSPMLVSYCIVRRHASATGCFPVNLVLVGRWPIATSFQSPRKLSRFVGMSTDVVCEKMNELVQYLIQEQYNRLTATMQRS